MSDFSFEDIPGEASPAENPYSMGEHDFYKTLDITYHSEIFRLTRMEGKGDNEEFQETMQKLYDPDEDHFMAIPGGAKRSQSWTQEGDLMIHLEYLEVYEKASDEDEDADMMDY